MFEVSVKGTLGLINRQLAQIRNQNHTPAAIFLSGGFSQSPYLRKRVRSLADANSCQLYCEGDQWTAVAQGAVLMGLGAGCNVPPAQLQCTVNIGVVLSSNFTKSAHQRSQRYEDTFDGTLRGANEIKWVARKGDLVGPETGITEIVPVRQKFTAGDDGTGRVTVVLSHKDLLPTETHVYQANESGKCAIISNDRASLLIVDCSVKEISTSEA